MGRSFPIAVATAIVLGSLGFALVNGKSAGSGFSVASATDAARASTSATASTQFDARRAEMMQRIEQARHAGQLRGIGYMALLGEQQSLLVAQRRVEAQGMAPDAVRQLNADLDRASAHIDRQLQK
jgi:hypothetical protein